MNWNQNETRRLRSTDCGLRNANSRESTTCRRSVRSRLSLPPHSEFRNPNSAFTLTELLVVITIIAILAGLVTAAAVNALNRGKQTAITLELQQLSGAMEDIKNQYGAYPPNVFPNGDATLGLSNQEQTANAQTLLRFLKKAFARSTEFNINLSGASPTRGTPPASDNVFPIAIQGLSPSEALVFWLQGFSSDISRPLSGTDLQVSSIDDNGTLITDVVTIDSFQPRYDFDRGRLRLSRNADGDRRYITMNRADGTEFYVQLYEYLATNSNEPYIYFDTSREAPTQVVDNWETTEFFYSSPTSGGAIFPLKRLRANAPEPGSMPSPAIQFVDYVNQEKFQILHCGIDDLWGDFSNSSSGSQGELEVGGLPGDIPPLRLLFPEGPFIGDIADTVGNFMTGTLEDAQE